MAGAAVPLLIAGTAVSAYSAYQQGKVAGDQADFAAQQAMQEAEWHDFNAQVAEREAEAERQATAFDAIQHTREGKQIQARLRARRGQSGVTMEGSPLLVAEDTAGQLALENYNIRLTGQRRVGQWKSQAILDTKRAGASRATASSYADAAPGLRRAGVMRAGSSILLGGAQAAYWKSTT